MMATCFNTDDTQSRVNVYGVDVEVDYRGSEVTVENFFRLLTDRLPHGTPRSKRLLSDDRSNIILFMTGTLFAGCIQLIYNHRTRRRQFFEIPGL